VTDNLFVKMQRDNTTTEKISRSQNIKKNIPVNSPVFPTFNKISGRKQYSEMTQYLGYTELCYKM